MAFLYTLVPPSLVGSQWLGVFPEILRTPLIATMGAVLAFALLSRMTGKKLFYNRRMGHTGDSGFTLIELLMVISIIGMLAAILIPSIINVRGKAYYSRAKAEFASLHKSLELYALDKGSYPPDTGRDLPPGLEPYLSTSGTWPDAPWPGSVYDWDTWSAAELAYEPKAPVQQISIRFCTTPSTCTIPNESWASNFDYYSALYYCISGPCRSHSSRPANHPGYCINC